MTQTPSRHTEEDSKGIVKLTWFQGEGAVK